MTTNNNPINPELLNDRQYKSSTISSLITPLNQQRYTSAISIAIEDFTGLTEAYKDNAIQTEKELQDQFRIFLEEYTVNIINLLNK